PGRGWHRRGRLPPAGRAVHGHRHRPGPASLRQHRDRAAVPPLDDPLWPRLRRNGRPGDRPRLRRPGRHHQRRTRGVAIMLALFGLLIGALIALLLHPTVPQDLTRYVAVAVVAAIDASFGGVRTYVERTFND